MSKRRLRIAYATRGDVTSQSSFDVGTRYYIGKYLEKHLGAVDFLGPLDTIAHNLWHRSKRRFYKYVLHRRYLPERAPRVRDCYAAQVREKLERKRYDLVFSPDSIVISSLDVDIPIVFYTDAVFDAMIDFYPHFTNLCRESIRDGHNQEQCALDKSALAIYSSQWAVDAVIQHHEVDPQKVTYVPFGACLPSQPPKELVTRREVGDGCNLFFIGVDWDRKGGDTALQVVELLNRMGLESKLFVCSAVPENVSSSEYVEVVGLLDRSEPHENEQLENLFLRSHFLILPTRADCTPAVFREAAAYGLPVVTTDVGGNRSVVESDVNGIILPRDAEPEAYASAIAEYFTDAGQYTSLCLSSRDQFDQVLNWDSSIKRVSSLVGELISIP